MSSNIVIHKIGALSKVLRHELMMRGHEQIRFIMETLNQGFITDTGDADPATVGSLLNEGHFKSLTCISELNGTEIKATLSRVDDSPMYQVTCDSGESSYAASTPWNLDKVFLVLRLAVVMHSEKIKGTKREPLQFTW